MLMTTSLKAFRADVKHCFHTLASSDSFRPTGDCTIRPERNED